jgi:hypothetical protein
MGEQRTMERSFSEEAADILEAIIEADAGGFNPTPQTLSDAKKIGIRKAPKGAPTLLDSLVKSQSPETKQALAALRERLGEGPVRIPSRGRERVSRLGKMFGSNDRRRGELIADLDEIVARNKK